MRNIYLSLFSLISFIAIGQSQDVTSYDIDFKSNAQIVNPHHDSDVLVSYNSGFPNYQFTDIQGASYDIYTELGLGKTVVLSFMNYFTSMCQNEVKYLNHIKDIYETGEDMIRFWGIEITNVGMLNSAGVNLNSLYQDWGLEYPLINLDGLDTYLSSLVTSVPTYIVIKPDHSYTVISSINYDEDVLSYLNQNILAANNISADYDVDLYNVDHDYCNGNLNLYLNIQNTGLQIHAGFMITLSDDSGTIIDQLNVSNPLNPKARVEVSLFYGANQITDTELNIDITSVYSNENHRNNKADVSIIETNNSSGNTIQLQLQTDNYPAETAWHLRDNTIGEFTDSAGLASDGTITGLTQGLHTYNFNLEDDHCYTLHIYDSYGDGLCCSNGNGYFKIIDLPTGNLLDEGGTFQLSDKAHFRILPPDIGIEEHSSLNQNKEVLSIQYFDLLGRSYSNPKKNMTMLKRTVYTDYSTRSEKIYVK